MLLTEQAHWTADNLEALPEYDGTRRRFEEGFFRFVSLKKDQAARIVLTEEAPGETVVKNPDFIAAVASRVPDDAVVEKRYVFLAFNPEYLLRNR